MLRRSGKQSILFTLRINISSGVLTAGSGRRVTGPSTPSPTRLSRRLSPRSRPARGSQPSSPSRCSPRATLWTAPPRQCCHELILFWTIWIVRSAYSYAPFPYLAFGNFSWTEYIWYPEFNTFSQIEYIQYMVCIWSNFTLRDNNAPRRSSTGRGWPWRPCTLG